MTRCYKWSRVTVAVDPLLQMARAEAGEAQARWMRGLGTTDVGAGTVAAG